MKKVKFNKCDFSGNFNLTTDKIYDVIKSINVFEGVWIDKYVITNDVGLDVVFRKSNMFFTDVTEQYRNEMINEILS